MFELASRHSETLSAEPRLALLSLYILRSIEEGGLIQHARRLGSAMLARLETAFGDCFQVGDIRGRGLMIGIEFVDDPHTKQHAIELRDRVIKNCVFKQRLWILGAGRSSIRLLPSLTISEEEAMEAIDRLGRAVVDELRSDTQVRIAAAATP
jgi:4-aminobutyrate aminotransferase